MPKSPSNQHGSAWGDYDNDGHLDLIVTAGNPELTHNMLYRNNGDGTFAWTTDNPIYDDFYYLHSGVHGPSWGDYDNDGLVDLFIAGHDIRNRLFHNDGDGSFTRITDSVLVNDEVNSEGRAWTDYDDDGDLDLFVSGTFVGAGPTGVLYRNDGSGAFTKVTDSGLSNRSEPTLASCWADYDNDGLQDLFLANTIRNSLYHNEGAGKFTRVADSTVVQDRIPPAAWFVGCGWADYDNDGFIDLHVTTVDFAWPVPPRTHSFLYRNNGDGTFTKVTDGPVVTDPTTAALASWGDYDNDGFLDLFVSQGAFSPTAQTCLLYHNDGNANAWLNVKLVGTVSNRSGIGAKVRVKAFYRGESRWQLREISGGDSESNQQSLNAEFGLADATSIDTLRVEWPSGIVEELHDVAPRQFLTITERLEQQLLFDPLPDRSFGDPPFTVSATASSGLPVSFRASGSCTVSGEQVGLTGVGLCTLTAAQAGDAIYQPGHGSVDARPRVEPAVSWGLRSFHPGRTSERLPHLVPGGPGVPTLGKAAGNEPGVAGRRGGHTRSRY